METGGARAEAEGAAAVVGAAAMETGGGPAEAEGAAAYVGQPAMKDAESSVYARKWALSSRAFVKLARALHGMKDGLANGMMSGVLDAATSGVEVGSEGVGGGSMEVIADSGMKGQRAEPCTNESAGNGNAPDGSDYAAVPRLSDKASVLIEELRMLRGEVERANGTWRGLIFVERKSCAVGLVQLLRRVPELAFLQCGMEVGHISTAVDRRYRNASCHAATATATTTALRSFMSGELNMLVATSVLEEGLDVPNCRLVVLFNVQNNVCKFIQARGRARHSASRLLVLAPDSASCLTDTTQQIIENVKGADIRLRKAALADEKERLETLGESVPLLLKFAQHDAFYVHESGALATIHTAVGLLQQYCGTLPKDNYMAHRSPRYCFSREPPFVCTAAIPGHAWLPELRGHPKSRRALAKASAALEVIRWLHRSRELDNHFQPAFRRKHSRPEVTCSDDSASNDKGDGAGEGEAAPGSLSHFLASTKRPDCLGVMPALEPFGGVEASRAEASRAEASGAEASRVEASRAEASQAEASRAEANRAEASRAEASRRARDAEVAATTLHLHALTSSGQAAGGGAAEVQTFGILTAERLPEVTSRSKPELRGDVTF
eukprot:gene16987-20192_t